MNEPTQPPDGIAPALPLEPAASSGTVTPYAPKSPMPGAKGTGNSVGLNILRIVISMAFLALIVWSFTGIRFDFEHLAAGIAQNKYILSPNGAAWPA